MSQQTPNSKASLQTFDLAELAQVRRGERVDVRHNSDVTLDMFDETLALVRDELGVEVQHRPRERSNESKFVPQNKDLRSIFLLADALGSYDVLNDLVNTFSPGNALSEAIHDKAQHAALDKKELSKLLEYQDQLQSALKSANAYLRDVAIEEFDRAELHQLHEIILVARQRAKELNDILGIHYLHQVEQVVEELHAFRQQIHSVERSIDGIFMVNSEVLFVPTDRLVECVNTLFNAVGNTWLSRNIDGVLLLAARNLIIEVAAFHSYYGKLQIYDLFLKTGGNVTVQSVGARIRGEIRRLFAACKKDNKLVLTRIMEDAERDFEISADALEEEAARNAIEQVKIFMPKDEPVEIEVPKSMFRRVLGWFFK